MSRECPFKILGVHPHDATQQEVDKAYRHKALEVHPDKNPDDPLAKARMQKLNDAKERADTIIIRRQREAKAEHERMAEYQRKAEEAKRREDEQAASRRETEELRKATETLRKENDAKLKAMEAQRQEAAVEARRLQKIKEEQDAATVKARWAKFARSGGYEPDDEEFAKIRKQVEEELGDYNNKYVLNYHILIVDPLEAIFKSIKKGHNIAAAQRQKEAKAQELEAQRLRETQAAQALEAQRLLETKAAQALEREAQTQRDIKAAEELERETKAAQELEAQKQRNIKAVEEFECKQREEFERVAKATEELETRRQHNIKAAEELERKQREDLERATKAAEELETQRQHNIKAAEELERTAKAVEELEAQRQHNIKAVEELEREAQRQHNIKAAEEREAQATPELDDQQECEINEADDTFKEAEEQKPTKKRKHVNTWNYDSFCADGVKHINTFIETRIQIATEPKNARGVDFFVASIYILDAFLVSQAETMCDNSRKRFFFLHFKKQMIAKFGVPCAQTGWNTTMRGKMAGYKGIILLPATL